MGRSISFRVAVSIALFVLASSCSTTSPSSRLKEETQRYFGSRPIDFAPAEDLNNLDRDTDVKANLIELSRSLDHKAAGDIPNNMGLAWIAKVGYANPAVSSLLSHDAEIANLVLDIYIKLNQRPTPSYVLDYLSGGYKFMYKLLIYTEPVAAKGKIRDYLKTLPSLKALVLSQYLLRAWSGDNPDEKEALEIFDKVSESNFDDLVSKSRLFFPREIAGGYSETVPYYKKLQEMLTRVTKEMRD